MRKFKFLKSQVKSLINNAKLASKSLSKEICGLLVFNGFFIQPIEIRNKSKKECSFEFYRADVRRIQKSVNILEQEIIGTFHSHPVGTSEPGASDISGALDDSFMLVIDVTDKVIDLWHIKNEKAKKLKIELI